MVVRVDVGACKGSLVGQSEERMRQALSMLDHQNEVIAFFDEFEKMFAGIGSSGFSDGGTTMNMYQTWLNWSQNRKSNVFTIAACNSVQGIPAPAFRRGRFDQVFFVDLPSPSERIEIFNIHMRKRKWNVGDIKDVDLKHISSMTRNFVASEIEEFVNSALIIQFNEEISKHCGKRELLMRHFKESAASIVPSYDTNRDEIEGMRTWAKNTGVMWVSSKKDEQEDEISMSNLDVSDAVTRTLGFDEEDK
jgi:SpoVK/Ycf46/Vps4 family AAA+-type ATPase